MIYIGDEMFLSNKEAVKEFCEEYSNQINLPFGFMCRAEFLNEEIIILLKEAGCRQIGMGVECGDEEFRRKHLNRKMSNGCIISAFHLAKKHGIKTISFNMIGYPMETKKTTKATFELNKKLAADFVQVTVFFPFPGTEIYDYCIKNDLIDQKRYYHQTNYYSESVLKNKRIVKQAYRMMLYFNISKTLFWLSYLVPTSYGIRKIYGLSVRTKRRWPSLFGEI